MSTESSATTSKLNMFTAWLCQLLYILLNNLNVRTKTILIQVKYVVASVIFHQFCRYDVGIYFFFMEIL